MTQLTQGGVVSLPVEDAALKAALDKMLGTVDDEEEEKEGLVEDCDDEDEDEDME